MRQQSLPCLRGLSACTSQCLVITLTPVDWWAMKRAQGGKYRLHTSNKLGGHVSGGLSFNGPGYTRQMGT